LFVTNGNRDIDTEASTFSKESIENAIIAHETTYIWIHYQHDPHVKDNIAEIIQSIKELKSNVARIITNIHYAQPNNDISHADTNDPLLPLPATIFAHRKIWSISDRVILATEMTMEAMKITHALPPEKLVYIPYPVDVPTILPSQHQETNLVFYVCHDRLHTSLFPALKMLVSFTRTDLSFVKMRILLCYQDRAKLSQMIQTARSFGLTTLIKIEIDHDESDKSYIVNADIYVHFPLLRHGYDDVLVRAMLHALPIISIDHGYTREIMYKHQAQQYLAARDQVKSLVVLLSKMVEMDVESRIALGVQHRNKIIDSHSWSVQFPNYLRLLHGEFYSGINKRLMCMPYFPHTLPRVREGFINFGSIEMFDGSRTHVSDAPSDGVYNLVSDPVLQINAHTNQKHFTSVGVLWYDDRGYMQKLSFDSETGDTTSSVQISPRRITNSDGSTSETNILSVGQGRYDLQVVLHRHQHEPSWIDILVSVSSELVAPMGIVGHGARYIHDPQSDLDEPRDIPNSIWIEHQVQDGIFGTIFQHNMFSKDVSSSEISVSDDRACLPTEEEWVNMEKGTSLWWHGPQLIYSGMAAVNRELCLRVLQDTNVDLKITPRDGDNTISSQEDVRFSSLIDHFVSEKDVNISKSVVVRSGWPPILWSRGTWVMTQPWEFGTIPIEWAKNATLPDGPTQIWIPSKHVRKSYTKAGVPHSNIVIIPHGVLSDRFLLKTEQSNLFPQAKKFKFLFRGGMLARKGLDILLDAYLSTFTAKDDVTLIIHGGYENYHLGAVRRAEQFPEPNAPQVIFTDKSYPVDRANSMYEQVDCFVLPYRSEGFGLPILEAMAAQLPAIVTSYGPSLDFCNRDNSYLISAKEGPCDIWPCSSKAVFYHRTDEVPTWSTPDVEECDMCLRINKKQK
jgi:glycosyltransferase involved in cell wall biosynthesis